MMRTPMDLRLKRNAAMGEVLEDLARGGDEVDRGHFCAELWKRHRPLFRGIQGLTLAYETTVAHQDFIRGRSRRAAQAAIEVSTSTVH